MVRVGDVVRLLMLAACLVPFTSPRQASAAFALTRTGPVLPAVPSSPAEEEETERETETEEVGGEEKDQTRPVHLRPDRTPAPLVRIAFPTHSPSTNSPPRAAPAPADPFRNGLGSPYRC